MTESDKMLRLERLNLMISLPVTQNVQAAVVIWTVRSICSKMEGSFRFHPGNTLLFQAITALEQRTCIEIVDMIKNYRIRKLPQPVERMKRKLILHRDRLSHPYLAKWDTEEKQKFADSKKEWTDIRSSFILNLQNSINATLIANGRIPQSQGIQVTFEMADIIHTILEVSATRELSDSFLPTEQIVSSLGKFMESFYAFCSKHIEA